MSTVGPSVLDSSLSARREAALFDCLDAAVATTNAALIEVRIALREVQRASRAYVEGLRAHMLEVAGTDTRSMEGCFRKLDLAVAAYLRKIEVEAKIQSDLASSAAAHCDAILAAAHRIARVAFLARILSLNAAAKSAQITDSRGLDVIVQQLTRLSTETRELAQRAIDAGNLLVEILPILANLANRLLNEATDFAISFRESFQTLSPAATGLQRQLREDLANSDRRLRELVTMSHKAFDALRFETAFLEAIADAQESTVAVVTAANTPQTH